MQNLLNYTCSLLLLALILIKTMAMPIACLQYAANRQYIAENLCENRNRPEMHCNGQCQLKKQLDHANDSNETPDQKGTAKSIAADYFEPVAANPEYEEIFSITLSFIHRFKSPVNAGYKGNIFHPPHCS